MIKKVIFFSDNNNGDGSDLLYMKADSNLRNAYILRKKGYKVKQVHNLTFFKDYEFEKIIDDFADGDDIVSCVSTSFIRTISRIGFERPQNFGFAWGGKTLAALITLLPILKRKSVKTLFTGYHISEYMDTQSYRDAHTIDEIKDYIDYFIVGSSTDIIEKICRGQSFDYENFDGANLVKAGNFVDFSDCAATPLPEDGIMKGECLTTEIASGCVFSCQFCNFKILGKKKHEYMRSYESLKQEIVTNHENFKTRFYTFSDNIMNDNLDKLKYLVKIREETGIDLRWVGFIRVDIIQDKKHAHLLADSGMACGVAGIESLKKEVGPYIGKVTDKSRIIDCLELLRSVIGDNALLDASFILGLPTETVDDCYKSFEWINSTHGRELMDSVSFSELILYHKNKDKNTINIARNDPFRDYVGDYRHWTSPWGNSDIFFKLSTEFNSKKRNSPILGFSTALIHNTGVDIDDLVKISRKKDLENENRLKKYLIRKTPIIENTYKNFILQRE